MSDPTKRVQHPVVWLILYLPFGALGGFVSVALTFLATQHGLSIAEGALLNGASLLTQWLKWIWAPLVDISLSPKRWYVLSTGASALGILVMAAMPMSPETLGLLLAVIAVTSLINSVVGMAVESLIATSTPPDHVGRVSAWFQAGNLGGAGLGGGLGLFLITKLPQSWMSGAVLGTLLMACCLALPLAPEGAQARPSKPMAAIKGVVIGLWQMLKTKSGLLSGILCILPVGTGAAQTVLTQAKVAEHWSAGATEVGFVQGLAAGFVTAAGCFAGGWLCNRFHPRTAYATMALCWRWSPRAWPFGRRRSTPTSCGTYCTPSGRASLIPLSPPSCSLRWEPARQRQSTTSSPRSRICPFGGSGSCSAG